mmetsp:Transcript_13928/g.20575  ORF Transcript_13928/g.20575 Transcript_13928/m.20575 type:complete len:526 (-) Transcript_13928:111-1688(-)|eukprot:CAMPEP_0194209378 /NCGR_PEP_ID=MMETSP0156-20130528/7527_1 /TAXON_ID=33649 /ORGANISM="Thalassionema nitzschioides, Strain L26-B" /LENGTH=525 /DNA_ID=CAMNT_0038936545 /DNA_START=171 /DNA_END=1748 /DNA_ORIENTATION=+
MTASGSHYYVNSSSSTIQEHQLPQHYNPQPKGIVVTLLLVAVATMAFVYQIQHAPGVVGPEKSMERHLVEPHKPMNAGAMKLDPILRVGVFSSGKHHSGSSGYPQQLVSSPEHQLTVFDTMTFHHYGLCMDSILKEDQMFDIILLEHDATATIHANNNNADAGFVYLARKLRARYPMAIIIIICDWASPFNFKRREGTATPHLSLSFAEWSQGIPKPYPGVKTVLEQDTAGDWYNPHQHTHHHTHLSALVTELQARLYAPPLIGTTGRDSLLTYLGQYDLEKPGQRSMEGTVVLSDALYFEVQSAMLEHNIVQPHELVVKSDLHHRSLQQQNDIHNQRDSNDFCHYWYWNGDKTVAVNSDHMSHNWNMKEDAQDHSFGLELTAATNDAVEGPNSSTTTAWMVLTNPLLVHADLFFSYLTYTPEQTENPPSIMVEVLSVPDGILMQRHPLETTMDMEDSADSSTHIRTVLGGENLPPQVPVNITFTATASTSSSSDLPFRLAGYLYSNKETPMEWDFGAVHSISIQ